MGVESSSMIGDIGVRKDREKEMVVSIIREYVMSGEFMDRMRRGLGIEDIESRVEEKASKVELSEAIMMIKDLVMMLRDEMNRRFEQVDKRFDDVNKRFDDMNRRFDDMVKMFYRLFWLIIAFFTPLSVSMIGLLWKLFH
jgi:hypothetical protein